MFISFFNPKVNAVISRQGKTKRQWYNMVCVIAVLILFISSVNSTQQSSSKHFEVGSFDLGKSVLNIELIQFKLAETKIKCTVSMYSHF